MNLRHKPAVLVVSRQPLPTLDRTKYAPASGLAQGAYVMADPPGGNPEIILIASGSEVSLAVQAHEKLLGEGIRSRVVIHAVRDIFENQTMESGSCLAPEVQARVAIEQASTFGWARYVGTKGKVIGMPLSALQRRSKNCRKNSGSSLTRSSRCKGSVAKYRRDIVHTHQAPARIEASLSIRTDMKSPASSHHVPKSLAELTPGFARRQSCCA